MATVYEVKCLLLSDLLRQLGMPAIDGGPALSDKELDLLIRVCHSMLCRKQRPV